MSAPDHEGLKQCPECDGRGCAECGGLGEVLREGLNGEPKAPEGASQTRAQQLDDLDRLCDAAAQTGRKHICLKITRATEPKGRVRLAGRRGPLSVDQADYAGHRSWVAWWTVKSVRSWIKSERAGS